MWQWLFGKREDRSYSGRIARIEDDCVRRLEYVERHLDRAQRPGPWQLQMTIMDADIMPVDARGAFVNTVRSLKTWQWLVVTGCVAIAFFMLGSLIF